MCMMIWNVSCTCKSQQWILSVKPTSMRGYAPTRVPQFSAELATAHRWPRCRSGNVRPHLAWPYRFPNPSDYPASLTPPPLADMSTALLRTQPISIELSLTHFAHSLMKQGNRWSTFNEIRVGQAPLNHLSRLKARGLLTCHCTGYTKPDLHSRSGYPFWFPFFLYFPVISFFVIKFNKQVNF